MVLRAELSLPGCFDGHFLLFCFDTNASSYHVLPSPPPNPPSLSSASVTRRCSVRERQNTEEWGEVRPTGAKRSEAETEYSKYQLRTLTNPAYVAIYASQSFHHELRPTLWKKETKKCDSDDDALLLWLSCLCATVYGVSVQCRTVSALTKKKVWYEKCHGACDSTITDTLLMARLLDRSFQYLFFFQVMITEVLI